MSDQELTQVNGFITEILDNNLCSIKYDEGFSVTGNADCVTVLNNNLIQAFPVMKQDNQKILVVNGIVGACLVTVKI